MNTQTLDSLKKNLIVEIKSLDDEKSLRQVGKVIKEIKKRPTEKQLEMLKKIAKPIKKKIDLEELKREQNWKPINRAEFDKLVKEIDIQEPLEQLVADIGR